MNIYGIAHAMRNRDGRFGQAARPPTEKRPASFAGEASTHRRAFSLRRRLLIINRSYGSTRTTGLRTAWCEEVTVEAVQPRALGGWRPVPAAAMHISVPRPRRIHLVATNCNKKEACDCPSHGRRACIAGVPGLRLTTRRPSIHILRPRRHREHNLYIICRCLRGGLRRAHAHAKHARGGGCRRLHASMLTLPPTRCHC